VGISFTYDEVGKAFRFTVNGEARPPIPALEGQLLKDWMARYA
jgi:hypothetical protein